MAGLRKATARFPTDWEGPLLNLAYRFCRDRAQAADMAQDAFLQIFRALPSFREESTFSTWMISVATNVFRSHARRTLPEITGPEAVAEVADAREAQLMQRSTREEVVRRTVQTLPKYREAVVLFYFSRDECRPGIGEPGRCAGYAQGAAPPRPGAARATFARPAGPAPRTEGGLTMDELDRILSEEHAISPPPGFSRRVMAAVSQEAEMPAPIPFPWRYALAALAAIAVAAVVCTFFSPFTPAWTMTRSLELARAINRIDPRVLAWASSGIFSAIALARYSLRVIGS